jgi:hypothetical protein
MTSVESLIVRARDRALLGDCAGSELADLTLELADALERVISRNDEKGPSVALLRGPRGLEAHPVTEKGRG